MKSNKTVQIFLLLLALGLPTLITWIYFIVNKDSSAVVQQTAYGIGKVAQFLLPIIVVWLAVDQRFGFHWPRKEGMLFGVLFGLATVVLMLGFYHWRIAELPMLAPLREKIIDKVNGFGVDQAWKFLLMGIWYSVFHSLFEEYYWRWFVFLQCKKHMSLWWAIVVSSLGFMSHHVLVLGIYLGWQTVFTYQVSLCIAFGGAVWAWLYHRTQSLYPAWLSHGIIDAGIFWIAYQMVKDSL